MAMGENLAQVVRFLANEVVVVASKAGDMHRDGGDVLMNPWFFLINCKLKIQDLYRVDLFYRWA